MCVYSIVVRSNSYLFFRVFKKRGVKAMCRDWERVVLFKRKVKIKLFYKYIWVFRLGEVREFCLNYLKFLVNKSI